jgi:hypothetical protein
LYTSSSRSMPRSISCFCCILRHQDPCPAPYHVSIYF